MSQTVYSKLFFNSVGFNDLADGVNPHFVCPVCHYFWQPKLSLGTSFPATFDFNQKIAFIIPVHDDVTTGKQCTASDQKIELFMAVHKDSNKKVLRIQRSDAEGANGIATNWWIKR